MASTRNKNTPGNYCLEQRQNTGAEKWLLYENGANGYAYETNLAGYGFIQGQMPWTKLSHNPADIESFLEMRKKVESPCILEMESSKNQLLKRHAQSYWIKYSRGDSLYNG